jgi:hypothetical protein
MGTSFPPEHVGRKRCQPNLQQTRLLGLGRGCFGRIEERDHRPGHAERHDGGLCPDRNPLGRWTAQRGEMCLSLYEPAELLVYEAAEFPADAMYIGINRC